jgi:hypothetical protein
LSDLIRNGIYFRVGIHPEFVNFDGTLIRKPGCLIDSDIVYRIQEFFSVKNNAPKGTTEKSKKITLQYTETKKLPNFTLSKNKPIALK